MNNSTGFTLLEVLMALVVVALLSALAVTAYVDYSVVAKTSVTNDRLNSLKLAIIGDARLVAAGKYSNQGFEANCLAPPLALTDLVTQPLSPPWTTTTCVGVSGVYSPFTKLGWNGPYVSTTNSSACSATGCLDGWGVQIQYNGAPTRTLVSCGPDMTCGDADDITVSF